MVYEYVILVFLGALAGFINAVGGGGSILTLPMLMFMGLSPHQANGTNRIAIFFQGIGATSGYKSKKIHTSPFDIYMAIASTLGAVIGVQLSIYISESLMKIIIAIVIVFAVAHLYIKKPVFHNEKFILKGWKFYLSLIAFFFIGIYGGFIQVGTGILIIFTLSFLQKTSLLKANSIKSVVMLIYTVATVIMFSNEGMISWSHGLILAIGNMIGAFVSSRLSVKKSEKWIRLFLTIAVGLIFLKLIIL